MRSCPCLCKSENKSDFRVTNVADEVGEGGSWTRDVDEDDDEDGRNLIKTLFFNAANAAWNPISEI